MNQRSASNQTAFVRQASILAAAGILARVIGFFYRLPLDRLITPEGHGIYSKGYIFYNFFLILSSAGLPVAISKMVSERLAVGAYRAAHKVFQVSMLVAVVIGLLCALVFGLGAGVLSALVGESTYYAMLSLAPTVFIVAIMAVFRGYFQGRGNAAPTAVSQIVEQVFNAVFSLVMAYWFMQMANPANRYALGAAGGTTGTGIGALAGLCILVWVYLMARPKIWRRVREDRGKRPLESGKRIAGELIRTALPIIAGTAIFSVSTLIDAVLVNGRLVSGAGFEPEQADYLFGLLSVRYTAMSTLPASVSTAMATAAIPSIVASVARKETKTVHAKMNQALRLTMLISVPAAVGMGVLARPIIQMLFSGNAEGAHLLQVGAVSILFLALAQIVTGMLQAVGKLHIPVIGAALGALIKIPLNYFLVAVPGINVLGAVVSTIACYVVASCFDWFVLSRIIRVKPDFMAVLIKPLVSALIMGIACYVAYNLINYVTGSNTVAVLCAILLGVVVYFAYMRLMNGVTDEDIARLPWTRR